jgi:hypothetical protein
MPQTANEVRVVDECHVLSCTTHVEFSDAPERIQTWHRDARRRVGAFLRGTSRGREVRQFAAPGGERAYLRVHPRFGTVKVSADVPNCGCF